MVKETSTQWEMVLLLLSIVHCIATSMTSRRNSSNIQGEDLA